MSRTVVGLFNQEDVQLAKSKLVDAGYEAANIHIVGNEEQPSGSTSASETGFAATISNFFRSFTGADPEDQNHYTDAVGSGETFLAVTVPDDHADAAAAILERCGAKDVNEQSDSAPALASGTRSAAAELGQKLNVVEEELRVGKRQVQRGGVRVYSHVTERPVQEAVTLREERVNVTRTPVNRPATDADFAAFKEGRIELRESAEEAVVSKTARVVEEVVIGKQATERTETIKDTVRRTDVKVEKISPDQTRQTASYTDYEPHFREHFTTNYAKSGSSYDTYAPAYRYGYNLAGDSRYGKSNWVDVETAARNDWAKQGSGTWEDMKAAIRQGWDRVRGTASNTAR